MCAHNCVQLGLPSQNQMPTGGAFVRGLTVLFLCMSFVAVPFGLRARADPVVWKQEGWSKTDFSKSRIAWHEMLSGGPPKDGGTVTASVRGADGQRRDVPYDVAFAFAVVAFHPDIVILKE